MFYSFYKSVGGRAFNRYFQTWENARSAMEKDIQDCTRHGWEIEARRDNFNASRGIYNYDAEGKTSEGERAIWAVIELYFED